MYLFIYLSIHFALAKYIPAPESFPAGLVTRRGILTRVETSAKGKGQERGREKFGQPFLPPSRWNGERATPARWQQRQTCRAPLRRARVLGQSGAVRRGQAESFKGATRRPLCCQTMEPFFCSACTPSQPVTQLCRLFYSTPSRSPRQRRHSGPPLHAAVVHSRRVHAAVTTRGRVAKLEEEAASRSPHASQGRSARVHKGEAFHNRRSAR